MFGPGPGTSQNQPQNVDFESFGDQAQELAKTSPRRSILSLFGPMHLQAALHSAPPSLMEFLRVELGRGLYLSPPRGQMTNTPSLMGCAKSLIPDGVFSDSSLPRRQMANPSSLMGMFDPLRNASSLMVFFEVCALSGLNPDQDRSQEIHFGALDQAQELAKTSPRRSILNLFGPRPRN